MIFDLRLVTRRERAVPEIQRMHIADDKVIMKLSRVTRLSARTKLLRSWKCIWMCRHRIATTDIETNTEIIEW